MMPFPVVENFHFGYNQPIYGMPLGVNPKLITSSPQLVQDLVVVYIIYKFELMFNTGNTFHLSNRLISKEQIRKMFNDFTYGILVLLFIKKMRSMNEVTFESDIFYSKIAVFQYGLENPFNDWNDTHVNQGFAWRKGSVSFRTITDDEECKISVRVTDKKEVDRDATRAITVPFYISHKGIEVGSIMETKAIDIEEGMYGLLFTVQRLGNGLDHYSYAFIKNDNPMAKIIKADEELNPPSVLEMNAEPAI